MPQPVTDPDLLRQLEGGGPKAVTDPALLAQLEGGQSRSWSSIPGEALSNVPASAGRFARDVAQPFIHPIETARNLKNIGQGVTEKLGITSGTEHTKYADAVGKFFADRYGGMENFKKTLATDPVGFAGDLSTVLTGGGGVAARAPGMVGRVGEVAGAAGRAVEPLSAAGRAAGAVLPKVTPEARTLGAKGVQMTPGQLVGGTGKSIEDKASSIPILGDFIKSGRQQSIDTFNTAVANQALQPIGERLARGTAAGHETIGEVESKIGQAYDRLLPRLNWYPDQQFQQDFNRVLARDVAVLPQQHAQQFQAILQSRVGNIGPMSGREFKTVESELKYFADQYRSAGDPAQRGLGRALDNTISAARAGLERSNPQFQGELQKINYGYAMFARMRDAAANRRTSAGTFTPSDLLAAVKRGDKSVGKGSFARGDALMQQFAEAGQKVLPSSVPDSGTAGRRMLGEAMIGGGALMGHPGAAAAGAAAILPYTGPGMAGVNKLAMRPPSKGLSPTVGNTAFQAGRMDELAPGGGDALGPQSFLDALSPVSSAQAAENPIRAGKPPAGEVLAVKPTHEGVLALPEVGGGIGGPRSGIGGPRSGLGARLSAVKSDRGAFDALLPELENLSGKELKAAAKEFLGREPTQKTKADIIASIRIRQRQDEQYEATSREQGEHKDFTPTSSRTLDELGKAKAALGTPAEGTVAKPPADKKQQQIEMQRARMEAVRRQQSNGPPPPPPWWSNLFGGNR